MASPGAGGDGEPSDDQVKCALARLLRCQGAGGTGSAAEDAVAAARDFVGTGPGTEDVQAAKAAVAEMLQRARDGGDQVAQGHLCVAASHLELLGESREVARTTAEEALRLLKASGHAKGIAAALDAGFQVESASGNPNAGLRAANQELEAARAAGNRALEAAVAEVVAAAHASLGQPQSAVAAAQRAVDGYRILGDKDREGGMLHLIAEMLWALGRHADATEAARQALAAYTSARNVDGEERALATISSLLAVRGQIEKAPNRQEALKALKALATAVEKKDNKEATAAEARLNKMRDLVRDGEVAEHLSPILQKDPTAYDFLKDLGWGFGAAENVGGTYLKNYDHKAFYLHCIMTGMNFGPQFRPCYPWRQGRKPEDFMGVEVVQLEETESWQMEMGYRPGILDAGLQFGSVLGFP